MKSESSFLCYCFCYCFRIIAFFPSSRPIPSMFSLGKSVAKLLQLTPFWHSCCVFLSADRKARKVVNRKSKTPQQAGRRKRGEPPSHCSLRAMHPQHSKECMSCSSSGRSLSPFCRRPSGSTAYFRWQIRHSGMNPEPKASLISNTLYLDKTKVCTALEP